MTICTAPRVGTAGTGRYSRGIRCALLLACVAALTACASAPGQGAGAAPAAAAPAIVAMDEWMAQGDAAVKEGDHTKARAAWRSATKDYPTAKRPWLKLSEDYFNTADYGNAVLAAQEALQRDPHDRLANSVLAVSGLRLTAGSLAALRDDGAYAVGSREEAVAVTHSLREALGEPVLVPAADSTSRKNVVKPATRSAARTGAAPQANAAPAPRTAAVSSAGSPLDKLK
jgi:tetratricopeptide (TPR) repeat protein